jgi:hypothetical protein
VVQSALKRKRRPPLVALVLVDISVFRKGSDTGPQRRPTVDHWHISPQPLPFPMTGDGAITICRRGADDPSGWAADGGVKWKTKRGCLDRAPTE